jgi:hypothetical protein
MDALIFAAGQQASQASVDLHRLGTRCLREPASRRLDGEIYCAIHKVTDWNPLWNDQMFWARENGEVLVEHSPGDGLCWIEAPPLSLDTPNPCCLGVFAPFTGAPEEYAPPRCMHGL